MPKMAINCQKLPKLATNCQNLTKNVQIYTNLFALTIKLLF